jgi:hypothetical protein
MIVEAQKTFVVQISHSHKSNSNTPKLTFEIASSSIEQSPAIGGAAASQGKTATPNRSGTHGRRDDVDQSNATAVDDRIPRSFGNEI